MTHDEYEQHKRRLKEELRAGAAIAIGEESRGRLPTSYKKTGASTTRAAA